MENVLALYRRFLNKCNFLLGFNPKVLSCPNYRLFIPHPYRTVILISADFELAWAQRYSKYPAKDFADTLILAKRERINVPLILESCRKYNIPITWATVGHLHLKNCSFDNKRKHPEIPAVRAYNGPFWDFDGNDWFEHDPCTDYLQDPLWYAPDLIDQIRNEPVGHEIACHTFSHIDCRDSVCPPELMHAELIECKRAALNCGLELRSFVHPGYTIGNLGVLAKEGFSNFRTDYRNALGYPRKHCNGLWEFEQTAEFIFNKEWTVDYHIWRFQKIIKRAIDTRTLCVLWFHPSFSTIIIEEIWPEVFSLLNKYRDLIWVTTHAEYAGWLNKQEYASQKIK